MSKKRKKNAFEMLLKPEAVIKNDEIKKYHCFHSFQKTLLTSADFSIIKFRRFTLLDIYCFTTFFFFKH